MAYNIPELYTDILMRLRTDGIVEDSRNGKVITVPYPVLFTVENPMERVLVDERRRANPFFHVVETAWMIAGENRVEPLLYFNSGMANYADNGIINGAYGHRWINHFHANQLWEVVDELNMNPLSRQLVVTMWDPMVDMPAVESRDRPCNLQLIFRVVDGKLDMTVTNRSNDAIWGMAGANAVHLTYVQELVANTAGLPVGRYHVMSNNLHIYEQHWPLMEVPMVEDIYGLSSVAPMPLLQPTEDYLDLYLDCKAVMAGVKEPARTVWAECVLHPMIDCYRRRKGDTPIYGYDVENIKASDWRTAVYQWNEWMDK